MTKIETEAEMSARVNRECIGILEKMHPECAGEVLLCEACGEIYHRDDELVCEQPREYPR